ncbi:homogentisate 1,2-dioxygenase [Horticoccus luteus]|uniref:Homogentisate 1,2-dioxygenase n=1 Tax=Horticoccus luteus TaxID=2862869 RepID=A0A8F9XG49_9BACT|nr:homogentisate 1,2-dioxygenase [Horticoccus luteus]QYM78772.1 homogentisate 1,2-dioxygenase [Horticoccus luteus]
MPHYVKLGEIPRKHHIRFPRAAGESFKGEGLHYEHIVTTEGFDRAYSILYHRKPPTRVKSVELLREMAPRAAGPAPLRHHHIKTADLPRRGDPYTGRVPIFFNADITCHRCRPATAMAEGYEFYRNGQSDDIIFVWRGGGWLESNFGRLRYRQDDYMVIPRGAIYRLVPDDVTHEDYLILESAHPVRIPARYLHPEGQIRLGAPYSERDFHGPTELAVRDEEGDFAVLLKDRARLTRVVLASHPFDVVGWDGGVYPFTFNANDFEPITGTVHLPPPIHQTFEIKGYVVCTFAPRWLDHHPEAVRVPWAHDNSEADEVLFYVRGNFGSRKGIEPGSFTLHPQGIPHGPHPGTTLASMNAQRTEELAVMFDTQFPLQLTEEALGQDDAAYPLSWLG